MSEVLQNAHELFAGFSKLNRIERLHRLVKMGALTEDDILFLETSVDEEINHLADNFIENAIGCFPLPLGVAANFRIDGRDYVIPMAVEETSIIAAASNIAKWIRHHGELTTASLGNEIIGQIQIARPKNIDALKSKIEKHASGLIHAANRQVVPNLVARGGGVRELQVRSVLREDNTEMAVIHVLMNPCDAMGANLINQVCEFLKGPIQQLTEEIITMCILSNLVDTKLTQAKIIIENIDPEIGEGIAEASAFAQHDPYRAATNNKGVLNGMDAVLIATGNDWRAVEAGVHAYAARSGQYRSISEWRMQNNNLIGTLTAPIIVGTVGGVTKLHPTAQLCLRMLKINSADELSRIVAAVGLVQNLGAIKALSGAGIVTGHMKLHIKNILLTLNASETEKEMLMPILHDTFAKQRKITETDARQLLQQIRQQQYRSDEEANKEVIMKPDFSIKTHAKWVLSGEHAVLRGHPALVFPIPSKFIELNFWRDDSALSVELNTPHGETFLVLFWGVFEEGLKLVNKKHHDVTGKLFFNNNIPMGAGMGFSAAFCVSMARWFHWLGWIPETERFDFARQLENYFHGKSSGVDIAGALSDRGVHFEMPHTMHPVHLAWRPQIYLSSSNHVSVTAKCINLVKELWESDKSLAEKIDLDMAKSVKLAEHALQSSSPEAFSELKNAIDLGNSCFERWSLLSHDLLAHMQKLKDAGAVAVKPTGAGDGGYVISLWEKTPELSFEMIAVF